MDEQVIREQVARIVNTAEADQTLAAWTTLGAAVSVYYRELVRGGVPEEIASFAIHECTAAIMRKVLWPSDPPVCGCA